MSHPFEPLFDVCFADTQQSSIEAKLPDGRGGFAVIQFPAQPGLMHYDELIRSGATITPYKPTKLQLAAYAASKRYDLEVGGLASENFGPLLTDRTTQAMLGRAIQSIDLGLIADSVNWKSPAGFVALSRSQLLSVAAEIAAHVQGAFNTEMRALSDIEGGQIISNADVDAAFGA